MQQKGQNQSLLETTKENYIVPKGERHLVHYLVERVKFDNARRVSKPTLVKTPVSMFDKVMRNLELQGNRIEIVYHPQGRYNNPEPIALDGYKAQKALEEERAKNKAFASEMEEMKAQFAEEMAKMKAEMESQKDALKAELAKAKETSEKRTCTKKEAK